MEINGSGKMRPSQDGWDRSRGQGKSQVPRSPRIVGSSIETRRVEGDVLHNGPCTAGTSQANQSHGPLVFRDPYNMSKTAPFSADLNHRYNGTVRQ